MKIHLLALPHVLDASLGISLSLFQTANTLLQAQGRKHAFQVTVTAMRAGACTTAAGLTLQMARAVRDLPTPDLVLLPGSFVSSPKEMESWLTTPNVQDACRYIEQLSTSTLSDHVAFAASCAGTFVLAQAGLLRHRHATTPWWLRHPFQKRFPDVTLDMQRMVVEDGNVTTAGAALAQGDLVMHVISKHAGAQLAYTCSRYLLMDERGAQGRYALVQPLASQHPHLQQAEHWLRTRLHQPVRISDLADALHLTPRTLARRFEQTLGLSPLQFLQRLRIEQTIHLLLTTNQSFEAIALQVGYTEPNALRRLLVREVGVTPAQLRNQRQASPMRS